jgi:hypothetical protein
LSAAGKRIPEAGGFRVGSLWQGIEQMLITDSNPRNPFGYVSEVMAINGRDRSRWVTAPATSARIVQVDQRRRHGEHRRTPPRASRISTRKPVCRARFCEDRETIATSISDDGKVITGASRLCRWDRRRRDLHARHGLEADERVPRQPGRARNVALARAGRTRLGQRQVLTGTAFPLAADFYQATGSNSTRCSSATTSDRGGKTLRVGFPRRWTRICATAMRWVLPGDGPL